MTVSQMAGLYWNTYQFVNNQTASNSSGLTSDTEKMQAQMGVSNLGAALALPSQTGDLSAVSNLDAYVSGLYTESQLPSNQALSQLGIYSKSSLSGITNTSSYVQSQYLAQKLGLTSSTAGSANLNAVTTSSQYAQINRTQALLQSSPATVIQLYQNYLSSGFPGAVFSQIA